MQEIDEQSQKMWHELRSSADPRVDQFTDLINRLGAGDVLCEMSDVFRRNVKSPDDIVSFISQLALFNIVIVASTSLSHNMDADSFNAGVDIMHDCINDFAKKFMPFFEGGVPDGR